MSERLRFDDAFYPVPPAAVDADPAAAIRDLLYRVARLEQSLEEQRLQAIADMQELLLDLIALSDDVTNLAQRWGLATRAQEAGLAGGVIALGKRLLTVLKQHQVTPVNVIGAPLDPETSDMVAVELQEAAPAGIVLREEQAGYTWPHGLLRRAKVVVSGSPDVPSDRGVESVGAANDSSSAVA